MSAPALPDNEYQSTPRTPYFRDTLYLRGSRRLRNLDTVGYRRELRRPEVIVTVIVIQDLQVQRVFQERRMCIRIVRGLYRVVAIVRTQLVGVGAEATT